MASRKRQRLESTVAAIQKRYGRQALQRGTKLRPPAPKSHISTGFAELDSITGCGGAPSDGITIISGQSTSGKLTLAYKTLANAQRDRSLKTAQHLVAIVDMNHQNDPDYLSRCGIDLDHLLLVRNQAGLEVDSLLIDLVRTRELRVILLDTLADLLADRSIAQRFTRNLGLLGHTLREANCALLVVDEPQPPWQRWQPVGLQNGRRTVRHNASLHVELRRERWLRRDRELIGYQARACILRSRWRQDQPSATIDIRFNGTVSAHSSW